MASYFLAPDPCQSTFFIPGGNTPANGGQLFFYAAGSSTKQTVYKDSAGNTAWANPIVLDLGGNLPAGGEVWFTSGLTYKVVFAPSNDTDPPASPYWSKDNLVGVNDVSTVGSEWLAGPTPTFVSATSFTLAGDQTTTFTVGRRLKTTNTGGTVYSRISKSSFGGGLTTLTLVNDSGSLDSGLSAVSYGILAADNSSIPVRRSNTAINADSTDPTKLQSWDLSNIATSTQVAIAVPPYNVTLANLPAGVIMDYANTTAPIGWLECDGSSYPRTGTTAALFSAIGTVWGSVNSTSFSVPDFRGRTRIGRGTGTVTESPSSVSSTANSIPVASNTDKWITGMSVTLSGVSGFTGTITSASNVFLIRTNATSVSFATTLANAQNGTTDVTAASTGSLTITKSWTTRTLGVGGGEEAHAMSSTELISHLHVEQFQGGGGGVTTIQAGVNGNNTPTSAGINTQSTGGNAAMNIMIPYYAVMTIIKY